MDFKEVIGKLDRLARFIHGTIVAVGIAEVIFVVLIGVATSNLKGSNEIIDPIWLSILIFLALCYILLVALRLIYSKSFPNTIVSELTSERELFQLKAEAERQKTVSEFLVDVMGRLNDQTCVLGGDGDEHLCDAGIREGLQALLHPILTNVGYLIDSRRPDALIGIYLERYLTLHEPGEEEGVIVIMDNLGLTEEVPKDLLSQQDLQGFQFELATAVRRSFNNNTYVSTVIGTIEDSELSIYCSPMPVACDESSTLGVIFILAHKGGEPADLEKQLSIFNRVASNWVYRYNECIIRRNDAMK